MRHLRHIMMAFGIAMLPALPALAQGMSGMMGGGSSGFSGAPGALMGNGGGGLGGMMGGGGMGGMMGGGLPQLSSASTSNVAGVLGYCVQNNLVQGASATDTLSTLTGQSGVTASDGYKAGTEGEIQTANGNNFSLSGMSQQLKTRACNMVLNRAKSLL